MKQINKLLRLVLITFFCAVIIFTGCTSKNTRPRVDAGTKAIDKVLAKTAKNLHQRHKIRGAAFGMAAMKEVECLTLHFQVHRILPKQEIRAMLVDCVNEMVKNVHECEEIQPYLLPEGFSEKNVEIGLFFSDGRKKVFHPNYSVATSFSGKLQFNTKIPEQEFGYYTDERESFEEAVAILESQKGLPKVVEQPL